MKVPRVVKAMEYIDDDLINGAITYKPKKKKPVWVKWGAMAACLCLVVVAAVTMFPHTQVSAVGVLQYDMNKNISANSEAMSATMRNSLGLPEAITDDMLGKQIGFVYASDTNENFPVFECTMFNSEPILIVGGIYPDEYSFLIEENYHTNKENGTTNILKLNEISDLSEKQLAELLLGVSHEELKAAWGEPDGHGSGFWVDLWHLDNVNTIAIYYDANGKAETVNITDVRFDKVKDTDIYIVFHGEAFFKADLSKETLEWLDWYNSLLPEEQLSVSSIPTELYISFGYKNAGTANEVADE